MNKILSTLVAVAALVVLVGTPTLAVSTGSVAGVTAKPSVTATPTVTVTPTATPTKGEVKGATDTATSTDQSWFAQYWLIILGVIVVIVIGGMSYFIFMKK